MQVKSIFQPSLFPEYSTGTDKDILRSQNKKRWQEKKNKNFGIEYCMAATFSGRYGIPVLNAYTGKLPDRYVSIRDIREEGEYSCGVTTHEYDYELNRLWDNPYEHTNSLARYTCFSGPDFSLRVGDPLCVQIANCYRSNAVAFALQDHSVAILPEMRWSDTRSHEFCFDGFSRGGAVMVSTIGTMRDERSRLYFRLGFNEMLRRISPDAVVLYGDTNEEMMSWMPSQLCVHHICHERFTRARRHGR